MRVHTLSKQLDISAAKIISFLQSQGFNIKGPLNTLGDSEIDAVKQNLDKLKGGKTEQKIEQPTKGTKKKVFIRSPQKVDPRSRTRRSDIPQQIRPTQIPQKRGASKVAQIAMAHQKASAQKEKEQLAEEEKRLLAAREMAAQKQPTETKKEAPQGQSGEETKTRRIQDKKQVPDEKRRVQKEKPKFSKEEAIRAARAKRRPGGSGKPSSPQDKSAGAASTKEQTRKPKPSDSRPKRKPPPRSDSRDANRPKPQDRAKNVVLEGKALDAGISRLKSGIKTSVNADVKTGGKTKRRKKIVQDKKRFKGPVKGGKRKDSSEYGGRGMLVRKHRRKKQGDIIQNLSDAASALGTQKKIRITEHMRIKDLSAVTGVRSPVIIKFILDELNVMVTINQVIDIDMASLILENLGIEYEVAVKKVEDVLIKSEDTDENLERRPPVVTVLGHVDHGKTRLLDTIRKTNVAGGEAGGITQAIGAYQVHMDGRPITFIDTPGHEAFTAMRARGAKITDVAILVVACDDGVQPQTREAIDHAKDANLEIVVALNKIDLETADQDRVKSQLAELGLIPEEWGGNTTMVPISAKFGQGIDELLELVLLQADILDLKANPSAPAVGTIIEAKIDKGKGALATALIQRGTLQVGDFVVVGCSFGRIRAMHNENGQKVDSAGPSYPVEIFGLSDVPQAGDILNKVENEKIAREIYEKRSLDRRQDTIRAVNKISLDDLYEKIKEGEAKELNLIIKSDMQGSIEAIIHAMGKIKNPEVEIKFVHSSVGNVKESDVMLALASKSIILAFNVVVSAEMKKLASMEGIDVRSYNIIYKAVEDIELAMKGMLEPEFAEKEIGTAEIRAIFKKRKGTIVAGIYVKTGKLIRGKNIRILRKDETIWEGKLSSLKRFQEDAREVDNGLECGVSIDNITSLEEGDTIIQFEIVEVPRT